MEQIIAGKYEDAIIYTDIVDEKSKEQIKEILQQPYAKNAHIRIMPDVHAGKGCVIGTTMRVNDMVCPNLVGVDIGCGVVVGKLKEKNIDLKKLDEIIKLYIPYGRNIRTTPNKLAYDINLENLICKKAINKERALCSIGTLGGGNHFIEIDKDDDDNLYIVVHSGSRNFGKQVAEYYQEKANEYSGYNFKYKYKQLVELAIEYCKKQNKEQFISNLLNTIPKPLSTNDNPLAYIGGELLKQYLDDILIAQLYASYNRQAIVNEITEHMGLQIVDRFTTMHNYIDTNALILRKGAVSAYKGERLIIPLNMRDGSLICVGKGNAEWNYSAPHGAGRLYSRNEAKKLFSVNDFEKAMANIYTTTVNDNTLDECPMAYKNANDIIGNITPTVSIEKIIKPIYNFKAND